MLAPFFRPWQILILALLTSVNASSADLIPHTASYTAKIQKGTSIKGTAVRELMKLDNGQWRYRFDVDSFIADIRESVRFEWQYNQVIPHQYRYQLSGFFIRDREYKVEFDWKKRIARSKVKKQRWEIKKIPSNTVDRLGYQLQLSMDVYSGKRDMLYQIVHKGRLKENRFKVIGEERINTALGELDSIVVKKIRSESSKRQTSLWFSKKYQFLLLKMTQREADGEQYEINIKSAKIDGEPFAISKQL